MSDFFEHSACFVILFWMLGTKQLYHIQARVNDIIVSLNNGAFQYSSQQQLAMKESVSRRLEGDKLCKGILTIVAKHRPPSMTVSLQKMYRTTRSVRTLFPLKQWKNCSCVAGRYSTDWVCRTCAHTYWKWIILTVFCYNLLCVFCCSLTVICEAICRNLPITWLSWDFLKFDLTLQSAWRFWNHYIFYRPLHAHRTTARSFNSRSEVPVFLAPLYIFPVPGYPFFPGLLGPWGLGFGGFGGLGYGGIGGGLGGYGGGFYGRR